MSRPSQILVLTSCTALKKDGARERQVPAELLYAGQQHVRLMRGVRSYRRAGQPAGPLRLRIVSAGGGLLAATTRLRSYDETFQGLPRTEIRRRADALGLPGEVRRLLRAEWALILILLGDDYLTAIDLDHNVELGGPAVAFCGPRVATRLPSLERLQTVALGSAEAQRFSCGLVSLKGELAGRALHGLASGPTRLRAIDKPGFPWLDWLDAMPATGAVDQETVRLPVLRQAA